MLHKFQPLISGDFAENFFTMCQNDPQFFHSVNLISVKKNIECIKHLLGLTNFLLEYCFLNNQHLFI